MCSKLKKLNLRNNLIKDEENIFFLTGLTDLIYLNLNKNPIQLDINYKNLIVVNLSFIYKIDIDEAIKQNLPKNNGNLDLEKIFDLTKKDSTIENKTKAASNQTKKSVETKEKNIVLGIDTKNKFFTVSKNKLAKYNDFQSISSDKKGLDKNEIANKKNDDPLKLTNPNFDLNQIKNYNINKIVIDASKDLLESNSKLPYLPDIKDKKADKLIESKVNFAKIDQQNQLLFEKHKALSKEELFQKMEKINKELSQKSQDVTKRLFPVSNFQDLEKTAQKTFGKFKISSNIQNVNQNTNNKHLPGLLKKTRESIFVILPKINETKQASENKNESGTDIHKKEIVK